MPKGLENQPLARLRWVDRETLVANDYNPNHVAPLEFDLLERSILESGWTQPIVIRADGRTIIDGFHRWTVSARAKVFELTGGLVPVVDCAELSETQLVAATIRHNRARGEHGIRPMIRIVQRLLSQGATEKEIMLELGMQLEEVERLADLRANPERQGDAAGGFSPAWNPGDE